MTDPLKARPLASSPKQAGEPDRIDPTIGRVDAVPEDIGARDINDDIPDPVLRGGAPHNLSFAVDARNTPAAPAAHHDESQEELLQDIDEIVHEMVSAPPAEDERLRPAPTVSREVERTEKRIRLPPAPQLRPMEFGEVRRARAPNKEERPFASRFRSGNESDQPWMSQDASDFTPREGGWLRAVPLVVLLGAIALVGGPYLLRAPEHASNPPLAKTDAIKKSDQLSLGAGASPPLETRPSLDKPQAATPSVNAASSAPAVAPPSAVSKKPPSEIAKPSPPSEIAKPSSPSENASGLTASTEVAPGDDGHSADAAASPPHETRALVGTTGAADATVGIAEPPRGAIEPSLTASTPTSSPLETSPAVSKESLPEVATVSPLPDKEPAVAAVPNPTPETTSPLDSATIADLLRRGEALLTQGDISGARVLLRRAAEAHDPRAAFALGETYDPAALTKLGVRGVAGDPAAAQEWYNKAREFQASLSATH